MCNNNVEEHLVEFNRVLNVGNNAKMQVYDYKLTKYMCYLIVQNSNPSKKVVAIQIHKKYAFRNIELNELKQIDNDLFTFHIKRYEDEANEYIREIEMEMKE